MCSVPRIVAFVCAMIMCSLLVLVTQAAPSAGGVNYIAGAVNATTGAIDLQAVNEYVVGPNGQPQGIPADPADWTLSSSLGYHVTSTAPTVIFAPAQPLPTIGTQTITILACNAATTGGCFTQVRPIGWVDYELRLLQVNKPMVQGRPYLLNFELENNLPNGYPYVVEGLLPLDVQGLLTVNFNYSGTTEPVLVLSAGSVTECTFTSAQGSTIHIFTCEVYVPINSVVAGYVEIPSSHGQSVFMTNWLVGHTYHQPLPEAEYPLDNLNMPSAVYGSLEVFVPLLRR